MNIYLQSKTEYLLVEILLYVIDKLHNPVKLRNIILVMLIDRIGDVHNIVIRYRQHNRHSSLQKENEKCYKRSFHCFYIFNGCWYIISEVFIYIMTILHTNRYETLKKTKNEKREDHFY